MANTDALKGTRICKLWYQERSIVENAVDIRQSILLWPTFAIKDFLLLYYFDRRNGTTILFLFEVINFMIAHKDRYYKYSSLTRILKVPAKTVKMKNYPAVCWLLC